MKEKRYSISEASKILEVENHVLRYWEEELELNIPRNELGHRYYREEEIQLLNCIRELKNKGFQLKAVKEVLPDLEKRKLIDVHKLLATQVELENQGIEDQEDPEKRIYIEEKEESHGEDPEGQPWTGEMNRDEEEVRTERTSERHMPAKREGTSVSIRDDGEKMREFEKIMGRIVGQALLDQAECLGDIMGDRISNRVIREVDEVLEERDEREEARYKKLDEAIRSHQKARQEIAVARDDGGKKKSRFFRKNKRKL